MGTGGGALFGARAGPARPRLAIFRIAGDLKPRVPVCACARAEERARACVTRNCDLDGSDRGAASHSASPAKSVAQECRERRVSAERRNPRACNSSQTWSRDALGQGSAGRAAGSEAVNRNFTVAGKVPHRFCASFKPGHAKILLVSLSEGTGELGENRRQSESALVVQRRQGPQNHHQLQRDDLHFI